MSQSSDLTIQKALSYAYNLLKFMNNPKFEAEVLLAHVLKKPRSYLYAWPHRLLSLSEKSQFESWVERRQHNEPVAYLTHEKEFWSLMFKVTQDTLIPRPETELLVEQLIHPVDAFPPQTPLHIADLGTGSGAIALSIAHARPHWTVIASDISSQALVVAKENAQRFHIHNVEFYQSDWCAAWPKEFRFDAIVSNPPYLTEQEWRCAEDSSILFEPSKALVSGQDGLDAIRIIVVQAKMFLNPHALLLLEHGYQQAESVRTLLSQHGFQQIKTYQDLAQRDRVTCGYMANS
jgi:release factor glutamine methyltransferase